MKGSVGTRAALFAVLWVSTHALPFEATSASEVPAVSVERSVASPPSILMR